MTTFIAGFLLAPVFLSLGFSSTVATILSGLVLAAGSLLLAFLFAPKPPKPDDGKFSIRQTIPPRSYGYGTARVAGAFMLKINPGKGGKIYQVQALVSHRVNQFVQLYLNDDAVTIEDSIAGNPTDNGGAVNGEKDGRYGWDDSNPRIWVDWRYGTDSETPYWFTSEPDLIPFYDSTAVGNGVASSGFTFADSNPEKQTKRYPFGAPDPSWVLDLALVYDPRDVTQTPFDWTDSSSAITAAKATWKFTNTTAGNVPGRNPVLAIIHFLCFNEFGYGNNYSKAILPLVAEWKAEADICDEFVTTAAGGTQRRYELGGFANTDNDQKAVLALMLAACDGWLARRGDGVYVIRVGKFRPSGVILTDEDITGFQYQRGRSDEEVINRVETSFTSPSHHYSEVQCDSWDDDADQLARGHVRSSPYDLTWVQDWRRARRIGLREYKRLREPLAGSLDLKLSGINAAYERWIYIGDVSIPGFANRYIENRGCGFSLMAGGLKLQMIGADSSIDDWPPGGLTLAQAEGDPPPNIDDSMNDTFDPPANFDAYTQDATVGTSTVQKLVVEFDKPVPLKDYDYSIRWRITDTDAVTAGDQPGPFTIERHNETPTNISSSRYRLYGTSALPSATLVEVQIAAIASGGTTSDYSPFVTVLSSPASTTILSDESGSALLNSTGDFLTP